MKIDLSAELYDEHDKPFIGPHKTPWTLKDALIAAVIETPVELHPLSVESKLARYALWKRLHESRDAIELDHGEVALLRQATGALYTPVMLGQVYELLGGKVASPA